MRRRYFTIWLDWRNRSSLSNRNGRLCCFSSAGFSLWILVLARTNPHRLKPALLPCQIKIADFVVGRSAVPHAPLRIAEELAYGRLGMRKRILNDLPCPWIEPAKQVHIVGVIPEIAASIKTHAIRTGVRAGQRKFLKGLRLRIEPGDLTP